MFARFDENPAMNLQDINKTKRYGRTDAQRENSIPPTNKVCGVYKYQMGLSLGRLGRAPGVRLWGFGEGGGSKMEFSKQGHVAYQIKEGD